MTEIKNTGILAVFVVLVLLIFSCKSGPVMEAGNIVIRLKSEPERLNPILFPNATAREVYQYIFLPLAEYNSVSLEMEPLLITKLPDPILDGNGVRYNIEILPDAVWEDGTPITGIDYLFTVKTAVLPTSRANAYAGVLRAITNIVVDKNNHKKFTVFFDEDFILSRETAINFEILPKHLYDAQGKLDGISLKEIHQLVDQKSELDDTLISFGNEINSVAFSREIVSGAGPYKFDKWLPNEQIVLEKKEDYWGLNHQEVAALLANPEEIVFRVIPDENNAFSQLQTGEIDVLPGVSADLFSRLDTDQQSKGMQKLSPELTKYYYFILNTNRLALKSPEVRQACAYLTDTKKYIDLFEDGLASALRSFVPPNKIGENTKLSPLNYDLNKAIAVLEKGGWMDTDDDGIRDKIVDGEKINLDLKMYASGNLSKNIALLFSDDCKKAGINVEVIQKSFSLIRSDHLRKGDFDLIPALASLDLNFDNPYDRFHSDNAGLGGSNYAGYINQDVDKLIDEIVTTDDKQLRMSKYHTLQEKVREDNPYIYLYAPKEKIMIGRDWQGSGSLKRPGYFANTFRYTPSK